MTVLEVKARRPALVWVTQVLLVIYIGIVLLAFLPLVTTLGSISSPGRLVLATIVALSLFGVLVGPAVVLFYGLAGRRRWAWRGSIAFAAFFLLLIIVSQLI